MNNLELQIKRILFDIKKEEISEEEGYKYILALFPKPIVSSEKCDCHCHCEIERYYLCPNDCLRKPCIHCQISKEEHFDKKECLCEKLPNGGLNAHGCKIHTAKWTGQPDADIDGRTYRRKHKLFKDEEENSVECKWGCESNNITGSIFKQCPIHGANSVEHTCGSWPDPYWTEEDFKAKAKAQKECPVCQPTPSVECKTYDIKREMVEPKRSAGDPPWGKILKETYVDATTPQTDKKFYVNNGAYYCKEHDSKNCPKCFDQPEMEVHNSVVGTTSIYLCSKHGYSGMKTCPMCESEKEYQETCPYCGKQYTQEPHICEAPQTDKTTECVCICHNSYLRCKHCFGYTKEDIQAQALDVYRGKLIKEVKKWKKLEPDGEYYFSIAETIITQTK
jgi:hypothetical protein